MDSSMAGETIKPIVHLKGIVGQTRIRIQFRGVYGVVAVGTGLIKEVTLVIGPV